MDWINDFDLMLEQTISKFDDITEEGMNLVKKDFKSISSNADKFKWLEKQKDKEIKSANNFKKYTYEDILNSIDEYSKTVLFNNETKPDEIVVGKIYTRDDIRAFSNNGDNASGVLNDKNSENSNSTFITLNLNEPYKYNLENEQHTMVQNEYNEETKEIKYYAFTRKNANDLSILKNERNQRIMKANGLDENSFIYAFESIGKGKYKYLGKYIFKIQSTEAPFYFELLNFNQIKGKNIKEISNQSLLNSIDVFSKIVNKEKTLNDVEKKALVKIRCDQGVFRNDLLKKYNNKCPLTNIVNVKTLIASHIKPWCACKNKKEKLDPNNGILLSALADKLFDKGLITFNHNGEIIYSSELEESDIEIFKKHLVNNILSMNEYMREYMIYHNKNVFIK